MARPGCVAHLPAGFAYWRRYDGVYNPVAGGADGIETKSYRGFASHLARPFDPGRNGILIVIGYDHFMLVIPPDFFVLMPAPEWFNLGLISGVTKLLVHTEDDKFRGPAYIRIGKSLDNDLRADTRRTAHRYAEDHLLRYRIVPV